MCVASLELSGSFQGHMGDVTTLKRRQRDSGSSWKEESTGRQSHSRDETQWDKVSRREPVKNNAVYKDILDYICGQ